LKQDYRSQGGAINLEEGIKPNSYFKAHASELINDVVENQRTMIITQNGEAKVILQDIHSYEQMQESQNSILIRWPVSSI